MCYKTQTFRTCGHFLCLEDGMVSYTKCCEGFKRQKVSPIDFQCDFNGPPQEAKSLQYF